MSQTTTDRHTLGEMRSTLAGITHWRDEPCALIWFSADGNHVAQEFGGARLAIRMDGMEHVRGQLSVSLVDGRVVAGGPGVRRLRSSRCRPFASRQAHGRRRPSDAARGRLGGVT